VDVLHHRDGRFSHVDPLEGQRAKPEQLKTEPIGSAPRTRFDVAELGETLEDPMDGRSGFPVAERDLWDGDVGVLAHLGEHPSGL
jgi:hypothetical protein